MRARQVIRVASVVAVVIGVAAVVGTLVVRDQISRRDLFSNHPLRRLAALSFLAGREATVDVVQLLRDFIAREPRPLIRRRATQILARMEQRLSQPTATAGEVAG
jgi:hypothetical protein